MFLTAVRDGKPFRAEQKIRELIKKILRFKFLEKKLSSSKRPKILEIIWKALENINALPWTKYKMKSNEAEKNV